MSRTSRRARRKPSLRFLIGKAISRAALRQFKRGLSFLEALPATLQLLGVSVLLQVLCSLSPALVSALAFDVNSFTAPFTLLTHMLAHANWQHLLGNFGFGLPFMLLLERRIGKEQFTSFYLLCGLASAFLNLLVMGPDMGMIGSSGAIMGVMAGACISFGESRLEHCLGLALLTFILVPNIVMAPMEPLVGVAFYGHICGAICGMLLSSRLYQPKPL